jgi:RimJ/RimL family protein N-acetyltransferase
MTLRAATVADTSEIERMAARFLSVEGPYFGRFKASDGAIARLLAAMLEPAGFALVIEAAPGALVGMFGAFVFVHPITGQKVGSELCWWVEPEARGGHLAAEMPKRALAWAKAAGAEWFEMIAPNERLAVFYEKLGFERSDVHYVKVLQ